MKPLILLALCLFHAHAAERPPIPVILDQAHAEIFPGQWRMPPVSARATVLGEDQWERSKAVVERALAKYPAGVLGDNLQKVHVVGRLEYSGVATGGTNSRRAVYLANNGRYGSDAIESVFHAEFSSILLRNFPRHLDQKAWQQINPPDFKYLGSGVQAIKQGRAGQRPDDELHRDGFVVEYAKSNLENDFNSIACRLFMGDEDFWRAAERHSKVMAKVRLVIAFYSKLDASFTMDRFQSFRQQERDPNPAGGSRQP